MKKKQEKKDQFDSPWKEAFDRYFRSFMELCFPAVAARIDWARGIIFLDKELQEIVRDAALGEQRVDKLVQVWLRDGTPRLILVHVEVQHRRETNVPKRMYQYNHRLADRYGKPILSLLILADDRKDWRPNVHEEDLLGCRIHFEYPICKLMDLIQPDDQLAQSKQPSAVVVLANWAAQCTRKEMGERKRWKWDLTRRLYEMSLEKKDILELYRVVDWLLHLPDDLEKEFKSELYKYEQEKSMPYVTSIERLGREEGRVEGRVEVARDMLRETLEVRFGPVSASLQEKIVSEQSLDRLKNLHRLALTCSSLESFQSGMNTAPTVRR